MSVDITATTRVCGIDRLVRERGVVAMVGAEQVALFRVSDHEVLAVQQRDPFTGAHVMSRGLVGTRGDRLTVASPLHKQVFDLRTGECLDAGGAEPRNLRCWTVTVDSDGGVRVGILPVGGGAA